MKHMKSAASALALICLLSLAGCGSSCTGQMDHSGTAAGGSESQDGSVSADPSGGGEEGSPDLDELLETALLRGSVADFQDGSFQVIPDRDDGETAVAAADGMESGMESTTVSYGEDCIFQIANINSTSGAVELESATASDVKKSTSVYVYGETGDQEEIRAEKVLIPRFHSRGQRAKRTCLHVHLAALCAGGTRLAPTEVERRPAARVKYPAALLRCKFDAP